MRDIRKSPPAQMLAAALLVVTGMAVLVVACVPRSVQTLVVAPQSTTTVTTTTTAIPTPTVSSQGGVAATNTAVFQVGDRIAAQRKGIQYLGTIQSIQGDTADVIFDDTQQSASYRLLALRLVKPYVWKVGDSVAAVRGVARFYEGDVIAVKAGDVYTIKWDDGTQPSDVSAAKMMPPSP
jgi:hypothetical protein